MGLVELIAAMDSVLRQSKAMCPFMKKATAAGLRAMSTAAPTAVSPCGGTMSKLQVFARRCPVMGKAMAIQSARVGHAATGFPAVASKACMSTFSAHGKTGKAKLHTSRSQEAHVDTGLYSGREKSESISS